MADPEKNIAFAKNWSAEILREAPMIAPARQFVYPQYVPGEEDAMARGALLLMVKPVDAPAFLATCARGFSDPRTPTGVYACPNPNELCAVAGGYAYVVDVTSPVACTFLELRPVVSVLAAPGLLLFVGHYAVMAWGTSGMMWTSPKLSDEGVTVTAVEDGVLRGVGWKMMTDKDVEFVIDLKTGALIS